MPTERLEARICELAGHLAAATCQFLLLVADFDARGGWASWEMPSCAAWLSWKCQLAPGTAREHVRVARLLGGFPLIREEFGAGRLSYAKVRALTRIAAPETERDLVAMAGPMTAGQLERFARAHRRVSRGEQEQASRRRKLTWRHDETGIGITIWLPPEQGAVVLQAIRAWTGDVDHPHDPERGDGPPRTRAEMLQARDAGTGIGWDGQNPPWQRDKTPAADMADAIVGICGGYLSGRAAEADNPDTYQVIIHAGTGAITGSEDPGVSAETPAAPDAPPATALATFQETVPPLAFPVSHPAHPARCHVEDGPALSPATLQMIACNAAISTMVHDAGGTVLTAGRRTRRAPAALRRAARDRDKYRCRFPGCESRRVDLHHVVFWANGGQTNLDNLICLCKRHHAIVHDAAITPSTIIPPHSGERLDLHLAIWTCFANAKNQAARREREQALAN